MLDEKILLSLELGRMHELKHITDEFHFKESLTRVNGEPLIFAGDFNAPSHLDWTNENRSVPRRYSILNVRH